MGFGPLLTRPLPRTTERQRAQVRLAVSRLRSVVAERERCDLRAAAHRSFHVEVDPTAGEWCDFCCGLRDVVA